MAGDRMASADLAGTDKVWQANADGGWVCEQENISIPRPAG